MELSTKILSDLNIHMKYAKFLPNKNRRETWAEIVDRNKKMHLDKFPKLAEEIEQAYEFVYNRQLLPSMRSIQFAGKPIELNAVRLYNCSYLPMDDEAAFSEMMFLLLSGCGVGFSVQKHHVRKLPEIKKPTKTKRFLVGDSIEGWADAVKILVNSYYTGKPLPRFDFRDIREKGAQLVTSGGKAPGKEPLFNCLNNVQKIFDRKDTGEKLTTLEVHDIVCYIADCVLAGGIRRSATISLFSFDDEEMLTAKFGNWWELNPQRARANNSVVLLRHRIEKDEFLNLWEKIEASNSGEPGFFFSNNAEFGLNPCGEVSLKATQFCNLITVNASDIHDQDELNARVKAAAFIATLQASYTDFHYLRDCWKTVTEKEALIGVSLSGIASGGVLNLDMKEAVKIIKTENEKTAKLIGINKAARCTVVKPDGNSGVILGTSSGVHAWHSEYFIRRVRVGKNESIYAYLAQNHPELIEDEFLKPTEQAVISVPQKAPTGAITRAESAIDMLNRVETVWVNWIKPGHRSGDNVNNVSATVTIKENEWKDVGEWMWSHRNQYTALSVLPFSDHSYKQAPFEEITKKEYDKMVKSLHEIDLTKVVEIQDDTNFSENLACSGGSCEI